MSEIKRQKQLDYIIDSVCKRGYDKNSVDCNDYYLLLGRKEFKELVAVELYEYYFLNDRHEFDLQLLRELIEAVSEFFSDPEVIITIRNGVLQTIPSAIIIGILNYIGKKIPHKKASTDSESYWDKIKTNTQKIEAEFKHHDYILGDEIERIFDTSKEEIQPLLKLCGCKCYYQKSRSIWIRPGISMQKTRDILKKNNFRVR